MTRANAQPAGGGGGEWANFNARAAEVATERLGEPVEPNGTSVFDPVLCELAYRWFCPPGGLVLDPFAGGSVRGVVASRLGRRYLGIDLSERQVFANREQAKTLCTQPFPEWRKGDARELPTLGNGALADFIFSCPPYWNLERYSDDARDLSTLDDFEAFRADYAAIIASAAARLQDNRFACFVVGDVRDKRTGYLVGLPAATIGAFQAAGLALYNDAVLVTALSTLPMRAKEGFVLSRKLGRTHQYVLVFVKGDPIKATAAVGPVEFGEVEGLPSNDAAKSDTARQGAAELGGEIE